MDNNFVIQTIARKSRDAKEKLCNSITIGKQGCIF